MESLETENTSNIPSGVVELDADFLEQVETDEISFVRGEDMQTQEIKLQYVTNSMDLLNERLETPKYDPKNDLIKNEYEGGFTVWECTYDLIQFLFNNGEKVDLNQKSILDLGCGHGLVGIYCLKAYDDCTVVFQDYNLDVLKFATLPNIVKNGFEERIGNCRFISGDWENLAERINENCNDIVTPLHVNGITPKKYSAILMSEVLYNPDNYNKLARVIADLLEKDGICVISSKLYYFGAGGSVDEFKEFLEKEYPMFKIQTLQEVNDKKSNKREIFGVSFV
jgi:SAM-dependent methyltransferase